MEYTTYVVDGRTLVDNIHTIKQWVYVGLIRLHIPLSSVEAVEQLYKKSLEPKETPRDERQQKRHSGRPRKEHPLFDINYRTAKEFLERAKSETGITGVTFQQELGEEFSRWKEEDQKVVNEQPLAPPSSFSEALLRKLNIAQPDDKANTGPTKPKLVAKSSQVKALPFKYHMVPTVHRQDIPERLRPFFSTALWRVHDYENNPLQPELYAILVQDQEIDQLARRHELPSVLFSALRSAIRAKLLREDGRESAGMVEAEFPNMPRRILPVIDKPKALQPQQTNGQTHSYEEVEKRLEATALSAVEELLGGLESAGTNLADPEALPLAIESPPAELRPSISYAMAAGAKTHSPSKPLSPMESVAEIVSLAPQQSSQAVALRDDMRKENVAPTKAVVPEDEPSSDEEVVLFVGKKRRSQEVSRGLNRSVSRPATAAGPEKVASPKPAKAVLESTLKPQSPVFTPGQIYTPTSPIQQPIHEAYPTPVSKNNSPNRRSSPSKRENGASPNIRGKVQNAPRTPRGVNGHNRVVTSEDAQRQSEMILQRQREAIKRSAQLQEAATRAQQEVKVPTREIEMSPTTNPVVIDPDDFGRDYTIRANAEHGNGRGKVSGRRGGRGRGGKGQHSTQQMPTDGQKKDIDFVLKSGAPRGSTRGRGKLWVP